MTRAEEREAFHAIVDRLLLEEQQADPDGAVRMKWCSERTQAICDADPAMPFIAAFIQAGDEYSAERVWRWVEAGADPIYAMGFIGSFARLAFAYRCFEAGKVSRDWLLEELPSLWRDSDPDDTDPRFLALWREAWEANGRKTILDNPDKRLSPEGLVVRVYRGQPIGASTGFAWTTDKSVAQKFAKGIRARRTDGIVISGKVERSKVYAFLTNRGESEVIASPKDVR